MAVQNPTHPTEEELHELVQKGLAIYDQTLRPLLEPAHDKEYVVIHVDTGDYEVASNMTAALKQMRQRHALDGRLVGRKIGNEPDYGLASRLFGDQVPRAK